MAQPKPVKGGRITAIGGGYSGTQAGIRPTREERRDSVMISPTSKVGVSRFSKKPR